MLPDAHFKRCSASPPEVFTVVPDVRNVYRTGRRRTTGRGLAPALASRQTRSRSRARAIDEHALAEHSIRMDVDLVTMRATLAHVRANNLRSLCHR